MTDDCGVVQRGVGWVDESFTPTAMRTVPRPFLAATAAAVVLFVGFGAYLVAHGGASRAASGDSLAQAEGNPSEAAPTDAAPAKKDLVFRFSDPGIASVGDSRQGIYAFYMENRIVGAMVLEPEQGAPADFKSWADSLGGTVQLDGKDEPIERLTVAGRDAIRFETDGGTGARQNLMTEVDGRVLWLEGSAGDDILERFLEKLTRIEPANS